MTINDTALTFPEKLKAATSQSHVKLESLPVSMSITSETISKDDYSNYLSLMHDVISETESKLFPLISDVIPDLEERRKLQYIENDLKVLNFKKQQSEPVFLKEDISLPFALGIIYVVEGSSLGGRFILKNIQSVLGYDESNGAKYFAGYGNKTGSSWKNFMQKLAAYEAETNSAAEIIAGADYGFQAIHNHFSDKQL